MSQIQLFLNLLGFYLVAQINSLDADLRETDSVKTVLKLIDNKKNPFGLSQLEKAFKEVAEEDIQAVGLSEDIFKVKNDCLSYIMENKKDSGWMGKAKKIFITILGSLQEILSDHNKKIAHGISEIIEIFDTCKKDSNNT